MAFILFLHFELNIPFSIFFLTPSGSLQVGVASLSQLLEKEGV